ncbi:MAG: tripartite tricarboxylate transporter substrate binding protein [Pigmentiphaga sp.]|nr:tripartite tricarboxylate transporter substrate binding protein [Pigmentiphaga sp.]
MSGSEDYQKQETLMLATRFFSSALVSCFMFGASAPGWAQSASSSRDVIRFIVPAAPGGSFDMMARVLANELPAELDAAIVVENKPGAGNRIGADYVAKSQPDGKTWLVAPYNVLTVNPHIMKGVGEPLQQYTPVSTLSVVPFVLAAHPSVSADSVQELIALAKENPGMINYGSAGTGGANQLAAELFKSAAGVDLTEVSYAGATQVIPDLLAGRVHVFFGAVNSLLPHIQSGALKPLASVSSKRIDALPDVPTIAESGLDVYEMTTWTGMVGPAEMDPQTVARMNTALHHVLAKPEIVASLAQKGIEVQVSSPQEMVEIITREYDRYGLLLERMGAKISGQ